MVKRTRRAVVALGFVLFIASSAGAQSEQSIRVFGDVQQPLTLTTADLAKMPRAAIQNRNNPVQAAWEGIWLSDILKRAGVPLGPALRGRALTTYVVVSGSDGYQVVFSLGELDPDMTE